jgi:hypothetical protein
MTEEHTTRLSRRRYLRTSLVVSGMALGVGATSAPAAAEPPGFEGRIYGDGTLWATKGVADLPLPTDRNEQSYDRLFTHPDFVPVSEAAPGNRHYNGGRWAVHPLTWHGDPKQLTSYHEVVQYERAGELSVSEDPVDAFECPLVRLDD